VFCPRCGYNNVDTANFCGGCALSLSQPAPGGPPPGPPPAAPTPPPFAPPGPPPQFGAPQAGWGQPPSYGAQPQSASPHWSGMAIAGFIVAFFCGILGLVFSIIGYRECKASQGAVQGEGLAMAGIIISVLNMLVGIVSVAGR
jgi:hypothetical protein